MNPERYIDNDVHLSNKHCRNCYTNTECSCPQGRCWYYEQNERRALGMKAIDWEHWASDLGNQDG